MTTASAAVMPGDEAGIESRALVRALIEISKALHLETVAEGVELVEQMTLLEADGCNLAQAFLFARPMAARDL